MSVCTHEVERTPCRQRGVNKLRRPSASYRLASRFTRFRGIVLRWFLDRALRATICLRSFFFSFCILFLFLTRRELENKRVRSSTRRWVVRCFLPAPRERLLRKATVEEGEDATVSGKNDGCALSRGRTTISGPVRSKREKRHTRTRLTEK